MTHPRDDSCKQLPLVDCVDDWVFRYVFDVRAERQPLKIQTVKLPQFTTELITTQHEIDCKCEAIELLLSLVDSFESTKDIDQIYALCIFLRNDRMKHCKALQLLERAIRNITNLGKQKEILTLTTVSVTEVSNDHQDSFCIALPSQTQQRSGSTTTIPGFCSAQLELVSRTDDVTVEVQPEVLSQVASRSGGEKLNVGTFWFFDNSLFSVEQDNVSLLNSRVVALDLGRDVSSLQTPVQLTFYGQNMTQNASLTPQCVFWDVEDEATAKWNSYGCKTVVAEGTVTCFCNHLSFFAVLLTPMVNPLSSYDVYILTIMSRVGCSVSLAFLVLTLLTHAFYKKGPSEHSLWIHLHVCLSLLLLNLTFLINDFLTALGVPAVCVAMAALTHYALVSVLTWFTIEGLHLYLLFIRVFNIHIRRYLVKLALLGWGLPMVPVGVGVGLGVYGQTKIEHTEGGSTALCWMKKEHHLLQILTYSFFVAVLVFNITMFSVVLHRVLKARLNSPLPQDRGLNTGMVLSLLALSWMLGISWGVMTFSSIGPLQLFTFYIFCTVNGLHGFFLFLRYCTLLRKEKLATKSTVTSTVTIPRSSNTN
ncbi:adhesion G protein-coupled receptor G3-like [Clupea harengus]|uniref:Adhesion G protein-coupled receptor G3-like n=1 Tax=Clupea harengus TaxID=7950 RepID=A0A6P8FQX6_CLUHA|nr:adhesion G protein-coupled receptor G3-like [Clupea harengus]